MLNLRPIKEAEKIAVAIPTKNRPEYIAILLSSLANQTYTNWDLVINDSSTPAIEENGVIKDLLVLINKQGHDVKVIRTDSGWDRHQKAMEAVNEAIEFIVRIDDDLLLTPTFLEKVLRPFYFFQNKPLAATGGCCPEGYYLPQDLDLKLTDRSWLSRADEPTWKLQGHFYKTKEMVEVGSLLGHSICYRRRAVEDVGGWAVKGYSDQAYREESDLCARLVSKGYKLMVTTEALAWHLYSPDGGSRLIKKTNQGNYLDSVSDKIESESDNKLFRERLKYIIKEDIPDKFKRYKIADLEAGRYKGHFIVSNVEYVKKRVRLWIFLRNSYLFKIARVTKRWLLRKATPQQR